MVGAGVPRASAAGARRRSAPRGAARARRSRRQGRAAAGQLTYIDQKRLELARALALEPDLLLLDEWLAGLNPTELGEGIALIRSLRDSGLTIILVEHVMDAIRSLCDRCIVMNAGRKIAEGAAGERARRPRGGARLSGRRRCLRSRNLSVVYGKHQALAGVALDVAPRRDRRHPRRQRRRQVHPAQGDRRAGAAAAGRAPHARRPRSRWRCRRTRSSRPASRWCRKGAASSPN